MKLTGVFLIETGVINRGDGIGNIATVKKVATPEGIKVFFSPVSYKRALWSALQKNKGWKLPMVTREGGVVQRTGTIIDSEEFDFAGTMVAKPKYEREGTFLVDSGISVNNYSGDMEFMTNMAISKLYGEDEANIINKENFYGIYIMPFGIELDRVGVQEIKTVDTKIKENDSLDEKIIKIYNKLSLKDKMNNNQLEKWKKIVETIDYNPETKITKITLTENERKRRLKDLLEGMGELVKRLEGSERNLIPFFAAFSLDYMAPKYMLLIKDFLKEKIKEGKYLDAKVLSEKVAQFGKNESKTIKTANYENYNQVINELIDKIFEEKKSD